MSTKVRYTPPKLVHFGDVHVLTKTASYEHEPAIVGAAWALTGPPEPRCDCALSSPEALEMSAI